MKSIINKWTLAALLMLLAPAAALLAQPMPVVQGIAQRSVSVSGEGVVRVTPDMAILNFGVVTQAATAQAARLANAEAARAALNAVRALGIPEAHIQLQMLNLQQAQEFDPRTQQWIQRGFEAVRSIQVRIEDLNKLPDVVAEVVENGANQLHGLSYDLKDRDTVRNQALTEAVRNARDKATLLVSALDVQLGPVMHISEQSFDFPRPVMMREAMAAAYSKDAANPVPEAYSAGEIEVRTNVQITFGLQ